MLLRVLSGGVSNISVMLRSGQSWLDMYASIRSSRLRWQRWRFTLGTLFNMLADQLPSVAILVTFLFYTKVFGHVLTPATAFVSFAV